MRAVRAGLLTLIATAAIPFVAAVGPRVEKSTVRIPMRDAVRLSANVFLPAGGGRVPVILARTPYGKGTALYGGYELFVNNGYAVVIEDVRGRGQSEGRFLPMTQEVNDGDDTIRWIARQPWSNGRVAMAGASYLGIAQWKAALSGNPALRAIAPVVSGDDDYYDRMYSRGGGLKLVHRLAWIGATLRAPGFHRPPLNSYVNHLPERTSDRFVTGRSIGFWQDAMNHPSYDDYWHSISTRDRLHDVRAPVFIIGGWYDNYVESDLDAFMTIHGRVPARILIGPWPHDTTVRFTTVDPGPDAVAPLRGMELEWFNRWVKGIEPDEEPAPVRIFVMGENRWRDEHEWPLKRTRYTRWYLAGQGRANSLEGDGELVLEPRHHDATDRFSYDPNHPAPTLGGSVCCSAKVFPWGPMDQRPAEARKDVLVYTSEPLAHDLEVTGPVRAYLYVSTSAPDTDFTAKLVDVYPDGRAINLCDGILRLRYRESLAKPVLAEPDEMYRIEIEVGVTSNVFRAGHRIRLDVSSSNFPRFDRNPNTGRPIPDEKQLRSAKQEVFHGRQHPSYVLLPVIP